MRWISGSRSRPAFGERPKAGENEYSAMAVGFAQAHGSFARSRVARGRKCRLQWEAHGSQGTIVFDQENINELWIHRPGEAGLVRYVTGPDQPDFSVFCPAPGHNFGFNEQMIIKARDILMAIAGAPSNGPDFAQGLEIEHVINAMAKSNGDRMLLAQTI